MIKEYIREEVKLSTGCTEPAAVALSTFIANKYIEKKIKKIEIEVSKSIYKNGKYVKIPGANGERGNKIAAALGTIIKSVKEDLQILHHTKPEHQKLAREMVKNEIISIKPNNRNGVYVNTLITDSLENDIQVIIDGGHSNIMLIRKNKTTIFKNDGNKNNNVDFFKKYNLENIDLNDIHEAAKKIDDEDIEELFLGAKTNINAAKFTLELKSEGVKKTGNGLNRIFSEKILNEKIRKYSTAASYTRMNGELVDIMSSGGSGNQGIATTIPVYLYGMYHNKDKRKIAEGLAISHMLSGYIKFLVGKLAPICGAFYSAGAGATAGICFLEDLDEKSTINAIDTMISNTTGVLCDGAKESCAFRVGIATHEAYMSAVMAMNNIYVEKNQGFLGDCCSDSIKNISKINLKGMDKIDNLIIEILEGRDKK
ncbi:MAG: L-serine ammonia-lyase, iron-sulfur-dependent, subunit alpha [Thermotogota bacterium]